MAIKNASDKTGVDFGYMMAMAAQESGFNPTIKAKTSSATGLYQFIDSTWGGMVQKYGQQYGIKSGDRLNPTAQAIMGAMYTKDNSAIVKKVLGREANPTELYMGHFLGGGGVQNFLKGMQADPKATPATMKGYEAAAKANATIFYDNGRPRSFQEVYDLMYKKVGAKATTYAQEYSAKAAQLAQKGGAGEAGPAVKTAMAGGWISKQFPTLVGEREPEVLGPDGKIHRSVDSFLSSPGADVSGLMTSTAVKEAAKRAAAGADHRGAGDAMSKIVAAAGTGGNSDALLSQMLAVMQQIAGNTAPIAQLAAAAGGANNTVNVDATSRQGGNVFALGQQAPKRSGPGMSSAMQRVVSG
jgi:hypothetical protein